MTNGLWTYNRDVNNRARDTLDDQPDCLSSRGRDGTTFAIIKKSQVVVGEVLFLRKFLSILVRIF